jgi:iron complex outermembrane recepter protein
MITTHSYGGRALRFVIGASLTALTFSTSHAYAQAADDAVEKDSILVTGTRAVTATKTDTPITEIPQAITVVTTEQIKDQGGLTIREALTYTAGVSTQGDDSRGDFNYIRGFFAATYLDGLKRNFGFVYTPRPDINTLERVEVLLGPSAVLYGAGSSGGLVNMQSKRPKFEFGGSASISYGSYNRKEAVADITGPLSDTVAARMVAVVRDADMRQRLLPDNRVVLQPSLMWQPSDSTDVTLIGLFHRDVVGPTQYAPVAATILATQLGLPRLSPRTLLGEPDFDRGKKRDVQASLLINHKFTDALSFHSSSRIQRSKTYYGQVYGEFFLNPIDPFIDVANTTINRSLFAINARYNVFNTENHLELDVGTGPIEHKLLFGLDYSHFKQRSEQAFTFGGQPPLNIYNPVYGAPLSVTFAPQTTQILKQVGFYAQDQMRIADRASLVLGVRHDRYRQTDTGQPNQATNATTYRAGLTVDVTDTVSPYVSFSQSFEPISGLNQFGRSFVPLRGEQYEGGVKWQPLRDTLLRVSYYKIKESNALRPDPSNPLTSIQSGSITSKGFEFQADHRVAGDITVTASYTRNSTRISGENRQQDSTPKSTAGFFVTKTIKSSEELTFRFGGGVRHVATTKAGTAGSPNPYPQIIVPSYTLVDAMVSAEYKNWSLQLNAINLLDKFYYASCNAFGGCGGIGDPRMLNATLSYRF